MRTRTLYGRTVCCLLLAGIAALGASCDSTQPDQVESQILELEIIGILNQGQVRTFNVYDMYLDNDGNGVSDDGQMYLWCTSAAQADDPGSVPWPISVRVSVLRAGESEPVAVTSAQAFLDTVSSTRTETNPPVAAASIPPRPDITLGMNTYAFDPKYRSTATRAEVLAATSNPLSTAQPATYPYGSGLCSIFDPGPGDIDGQAQPFTLEIGKGDTVIVESRKGLESPLFLPNGQGALFAEPLIRAFVSLDGRNLQTLSGNTASTPDQGSGFRFSFTAL